MASPPFSIAETTPQNSDVVLNYPLAERTYRDVVESWLTLLSDPATGKLRSSAFPATFSLDDVALTINSTDAGASALPVLTLKRTSATPAAADNGPQLNFDFNNSAATAKTGFRVAMVEDDVTNGTEDTTVIMSNIVAGVVTPRVTLTAAGMTLAGTVTFTG